jgi:DNA-binding beta-propeller fold protein YncE
MTILRLIGVTLALTWAGYVTSPAQSPSTAATTDAASTYWVYVANESSDLVSRVRFGPDGAIEEKTISVGIKPADLDGAHGLTVSPAGDYWYVTLAHGTPYGKVWQFRTGTDEFVDSTTVGLFPATMGISADGSMLFTVNFNLHGQRVASSVSAVFTPFMDEARKIETCVMPHGSRLSTDGMYHYSTCMMSDQLVEIATDRLEVNRRLRLTAGHVGALPLDETSLHMVDGSCKPTWVAVAPDNGHLYIPCNGRGEILEIDRESFDVTRTFPTGKAPYNADVSPDGRYLVTTLKGAQAVSVIDLGTGAERQVATTRPVTHGVVISPDSRYAFISNESIGAVPGTIDVIDLEAGEVTASTDVQLQPGGISFWKMESGGKHSEK